MMCVKGVKIEFIYDKSKLWQKKKKKKKKPEEATGFWRCLVAASYVSSGPAGYPCPPGPPTSTSAPPLLRGCLGDSVEPL